ncbi:acyl carrier protein [Streptomyces sp. 846.5]|nr:acyl carrier protein [Streptomyces sp. 846.5]
MTAESMFPTVAEAAGGVFQRRVGPMDDFFSLGGDSLTAVELVFRLEQDLGFQIDLPLLLDARNFQEFAEALSALERAERPVPRLEHPTGI